ncbi:peptidoglycan-binding protein [soil metagenome]
MDDEKPRRRKRAAAVAAEPERGLILRVLLHSPKDTLAATAALAAVIAIATNAMFLQAGRHPSPMFSAASVSQTQSIAQVSAPLPRVRPAEAEARAIDKLVEAAPVKSAASAVVSRPSVAVPAKNDPVGDLIVSTRRVAAVQRALTEYGYGQLKPTGIVGTDTQAAIQKFERDRKMLVTGQLSDRLIRDLTVLTGRPIE